MFQLLLLVLKENKSRTQVNNNRRVDKNRSIAFDLVCSYFINYRTIHKYVISIINAIVKLHVFTCSLCIWNIKPLTVHTCVENYRKYYYTVTQLDKYKAT